MHRIEQLDQGFVLAVDGRFAETVVGTPVDKGHTAGLIDAPPPNLRAYFALARKPLKTH